MPKSSRAILLQARMSVSCLRRARKKGRPPERPRKALSGKEKGEGCPRNTRKDAKRRKEKFERDRRAMQSFSGNLSEPFMFRRFEGSCLQLLRRCQRPKLIKYSFPFFLSRFFACFAGNFSPLCSRVPFACFAGTLLLFPLASFAGTDLMAKAHEAR